MFFPAAMKPIVQSATIDPRALLTKSTKWDDIRFDRLVLALECRVTANRQIAELIANNPVADLGDLIFDERAALLSIIQHSAKNPLRDRMRRRKCLIG